MTGIFDAIGGAFAISEVISISEPGKRHGWAGVAHTVQLRVGDARTLGEAQVRDMLRRPANVFAAESGISVLCFAPDDTPEDVARLPVIAWAICLDGQVRPVLPTGIYDDHHDYDRGGFGAFVEMPDGSVESISEWSDYRSFDDVTEMLAILRDAKAMQASTSDEPTRR